MQASVDLDTWNTGCTLPQQGAGPALPLPGPTGRNAGQTVAAFVFNRQPQIRRSRGQRPG